MVIPVLLLFALGITVLFSSSSQQASQQLFFGVFGFMIFWLLGKLDYRILKPFVIWFYFAIVVLLIITFILGFETRGSVRWIPLGPVNLQPSEFAKPVLILALAYFWSKNLPTVKNIIKSLLILLPFTFLIFRQPDLGTALTVIFVWIVLLFASHISILKFLALLVIGFVSLPVVWFFLQEYQKLRFFSFFYPARDPQGVGFHVIQSTIAVGSGQILGRGLGRGTQSRLQFLPEFRTDFIFAFIAEELGFLGSSIVVGLYVVLFFLFFKILSKVRDRFGELIVLGVASMVFFQTTVNIGMNIGLLPITGITLPFLSYGGSSLLSMFIALGLVASVAKFGAGKKEVPVFSID